MSDPVLVEITRGGVVESFHHGAVAVLDADGKVVLSLGDIDRPIFPRSAVKGFQALPLIESGAAEVVFVDEPGFVTEGSWSNIFVERDGVLLTPPLSLGLLPGVLRAELIEKGRAAESHLRLADLAEGFYIGNSLRGLVPARLAEPSAA